MSLSIAFTGAPDGDDGPFDLVPSLAWNEFSAWVETLPAGRFPALRALTTRGEVLGTDTLSAEVEEAASLPNADEAVLAVLSEIGRNLGAGDPEETATIGE
jgi:hypothetical protein